MTLARVILKPGRDRPARGGNPWIFSQAIDRYEPAEPEAGAPVAVCDASRALIGYGYCNPRTTIAVRMLAWGDALQPDEIIAHRLARAIEVRRRIIGSDTDCYRLVNGDGDAFSGVVIDRYADVIVVQLLTAGADRMRSQIVAHLGRMLAPRAIIERSQGAVRRQEGLEDRTGMLAGEPIAEVIAAENGIKLGIDPEHGQKTGWFLDQRGNRARFSALAAGARVLDACCYAGGFTLAALKGGAKRVVAVDTSQRALGWVRRNLEIQRVRRRYGRAGPRRGREISGSERREIRPDRARSPGAGPQPQGRAACGVSIRRVERPRDRGAGARREPDDFQLLGAFSRRGLHPRGPNRRRARRTQPADARAARRRPRPSGDAWSCRGRVPDRRLARGSGVNLACDCAPIDRV